MVFGNKGETSGSGVAFSRDEVTGAARPSGDFLANAPGEDVVSGVRTPKDIGELAAWLPAVHAELMEVLRTLERQYGDMQDVEFTVEEGQLYLLQTRVAKRPAQAAVRFAVDAVREGLLTREQALLTIDARSLDALLHPSFAPGQGFEVIATGVPASPGAAKGQIVVSAEDAVEWAQRGRNVILVRQLTEADDVHGFHAAQGILTAEGGKASHAALVARGTGKPCVAGAAALEVNVDELELRCGDLVLREGDLIAIDGSTGRVTTDDVPLSAPPLDEYFDTVLGWADELRRLGVRANADTPEDARRAREFGAEGIGLCRTEHMFMAADRQPKMQAMILAASTEDRRAALQELLPLQREDFEALFEAVLHDAPPHSVAREPGSGVCRDRASVAPRWDVRGHGQPQQRRRVQADPRRGHPEPDRPRHPPGPTPERRDGQARGQGRRTVVPLARDQAMTAERPREAAAPVLFSASCASSDGLAVPVSITCRARCRR